MGIIINDTITFKNGISLSDCYCSINHNMIRISKNYEESDPSNSGIKKYMIKCDYTIWSSKDARINDLNIMEKNKVLLDLDANQLETNVNIFTLLYNAIKSQYTNYTDDI